ncbi:MAG: alpha amylase C-terminal domain-containing protein, partial [Algoriphagus sp.]
LRYGHLDAWDKAIIKLANEYMLLALAPAVQLYLDPDKKILAYERGGLIFVFSFHPTESILGLPVHVPVAGKYKILLDSDEKEYGGFQRLDQKIVYPTDKKQRLELYVPNRTAVVLKME